MAAILLNANRYALTTWWSAKGFAAQSGNEYLDFGGRSEHFIRPVSMEAQALAVSLKMGVYDPAVTGVPTAEARGITVKMIRSLGHRHLANTSGGWGNEWQSAYWAAGGGYAGWLMWDELAPADRQNLRRMVEYEANRFLGYNVPYYRNAAGSIVSFGDSKSEENAWNASVLHAATAMMPDHPNYGAWMEKSTEFLLSVYARPSDLARADVYHGRPLSAWLGGSNSHEDGTLVNHSRVRS